MSRADRFVGSMVGLAVGDALGYPVEGWTREQIESVHGRITDYVESPIEPAEKWRLPGLHSDDTQQALAVADVLINVGRADPDALCQKFMEMAEGPPHLSLGAHRGAGRNFRYTIQALGGGAGWNQGSRHTAGVGASMRVAPVGLTLGFDDAAVRNNAALQALVTHNDPRAVSAAFLVANAVGRLAWMPPSPFHPEAFLNESIHFVRRSEEWLIEAHGRHLARESRPLLHHMSDALIGIVDQLDKAPGVVLPGIAERASALAGYTIEHPCRGFAPAGVVSAFYFYLHFGGEFEPALTEAVNWGGDTDTVCAILGAICGAHHGVEAIPTRWKEHLRALDLVVSRGKALAGDRSAYDMMPDLGEIELRWTMEEDRIRREKTGQPPVDTTDYVRRVVVRQIPPRERDGDGTEDPRRITVRSGDDGYGERGGEEEYGQRSPSSHRHRDRRGGRGRRR
jgi:ADP-ribosyl-[dinitrogen reductase] hydrolase